MSNAEYAGTIAATRSARSSGKPRRAPEVQQPPGRPLGQLAPLEQRDYLSRGVHLAVERLQLAPEARHVEDLARDQPRLGDVRHRGAGLFVQPERERDP